MDFNEYQPIYIQIMDYVKYQIIRGDIGIGDKIPSVRDVAVLLKVNPNTVQRAYQELDRAGITCSKRGLGSFVVEDASRVEALKREKLSEITYDFIHRIKKLQVGKEEALELIERSWTNEARSQSGNKEIW